MSATNVQGAIDELYNTCFPPTLGDQILENNDLEKDPYECRYFFTGATPNNYITFNNEPWRIISVECDGTIKIMKEVSIGKMALDSTGTQNWSRPATLNTYLNGTYYNGLNATAKSQIVSKDWGIGHVVMDNSDLADQINDENATKWNGKVALITVSEYLRSNSNKSGCGILLLNNLNYRSCKNTTWMFTGYSWWTLSPAGPNYAFSVNPSGDVDNNYNVSLDNFVETHPSVYLSSDIKITGGTGSQSNPYQIK